MSGQVYVTGYRYLLEPPERGDCQDPDCRTLGAWLFAAGELPGEAVYGRDVLLVAMYADGDQSSWSRVCAACDERILRRWARENPVGDQPRGRGRREAFLP